MSDPTHPKLLLIGWDAADWQMIHPLLDAGRMPHLKALVEGGVMGNLLTLQPVLSPILWTSIGTGKRAYHHGITGFVEPTPDGMALQPAQSTSRRCKALWNILSQAGRRCHTLGWFASYPAEPIRGVAVSNQFAVAAPEATAAYWPVQAQSVEPAAWGERLAELRLHPGELDTGAFLQAFVPKAAALNRRKPIIDRLLAGLSKRLAECLSLHAATTDLMANEPWDFCTVYYEAIDQLGHDFMEYHPPRLERIPEEVFEIFRGVMTATYEMHDQMLGGLLALAGPDATVMVVSDHGFLNDHRRPNEMVGAAQWHRNFGVFAARGPALKTDAILHGATLLDIAPTVLTLMGLPIGADMEGKVLVNAFAQPPAIERIPSWEAVPDPDERTRDFTAAVADPAVAAEAMRHLVELGYIEAPGEDLQRDIARARAEQKFNLAVSLIDGHRAAEALPLLAELVAQFPDELRHRVLYGQTAVAASDAGALALAVEALAALDPEHRQLPLFRGFLASLQGDTPASLRHFQAAAAHSPTDPWVHCRVGQALVKQRRWAEAEAAFLRALGLDADNAEACYGLSIAAPRQGRLEEGVAYGLRAVALLHDYPTAHFQLGAVLSRLGWFERAAQAFEICVSMRPHWPQAHSYLARIYQRLGMIELAARARGRVAQLRQDRVPPPTLD